MTQDENYFLFKLIWYISLLISLFRTFMLFHSLIIPLCDHIDQQSMVFSNTCTRNWNMVLRFFKIWLMVFFPMSSKPIHYYFEIIELTICSFCFSNSTSRNFNLSHIISSKLDFCSYDLITENKMIIICVHLWKLIVLAPEFDCMGKQYTFLIVCFPFHPKTIMTNARCIVDSSSTAAWCMSLWGCNDLIRLDPMGGSSKIVMLGSISFQSVEYESFCI